MSSNLLINWMAFALLCVVWVGFAFGIAFNPALLETAWLFFRSMPVILQVVVGLALLPVVLALWIWNSPWAVAMKLFLVIGLAAASLMMFFPKKPNP